MTDTLELLIAAALIAVLMGMGVYLVITEHYWWAWIPFLMASCVSVKSIRDEPKITARIITAEQRD